MKLKIGVLILTVFIVISIIPAVGADNITMAQSVSKTASFTVDGVAVKTLGDETLTTKHKIDTPQTIDIKSDVPVKNLYVMFDRPPNMWTLEYGARSKQQGGYGFLHELVEFDEPQSEFSLSFDKDTNLADIYLFTEGVLPEFVQQWQPPLDDADMLLLPTHSDDEHVFFGGIIPTYGGELGYKIQVAYLNNHYAQDYRPHELLNGLWEVGIKNYPIIPDQFADAYASSLEQAKSLYSSDEMLEYQIGLLRRFKPEVVIGHDLNGEYGHGVHMLNAELLTKAVEFSADANKYNASAIKYGTFEVSKTYLHLYEQNTIMLDIDTPLQSFDGQTAFEVSVKGFAHHISQQEFFKVNKGGKYDCRKFGLYKTTVGLDVVGDNLFENITIKSQDLPSSAPILPPATVSSEPAKPTTTSEQVTDKTSHESKTMLQSIMGNSVGAILFISGLLVILFTMIMQNKKKNERIKATIDAYKSAMKD